MQFLTTDKILPVDHNPANNVTNNVTMLLHKCAMSLMMHPGYPESHAAHGIQEYINKSSPCYTPAMHAGNTPKKSEVSLIFHPSSWVHPSSWEMVLSPFFLFSLLRC